MSTSRAYLAKRLKAIGRDDLLAAAERGEVTLHACALWAGLISQQHVPQGNGSPNVSKRAAWALLRAERQGSPLAPKPEPQAIPPPHALPRSQPKFSQGQDSRAIIERLVNLGRADLIALVVERKLSPFQAERIANRSAPDRDARLGTTKTVTESLPRTVEPETAQKPEKAKPEEKRLKPEAKRPDPRALIG
jgi:hypothetical protein